MAAALCGEGSPAFVGGVGSCSQLFRASIKGGTLWLLVVLTGAEHDEAGSVCRGTPGWLRQPRPPKDPGGNGEGKRTKLGVPVPGRDTQAGRVKGSPAPGGLWAMRGNGAGASKSRQWAFVHRRDLLS